jgi:hypothetical protein
VRRYLGAPASERGAAALPHTGGGGYWATGQISIQLRGQQLVVVATDMVEDVESGRPSSTTPARLLVSR